MTKKLFVVGLPLLLVQSSWAMHEEPAKVDAAASHLTSKKAKKLSKLPAIIDILKVQHEAEAIGDQALDVMINMCMEQHVSGLALAMLIAVEKANQGTVNPEQLARQLSFSQQKLMGLLTSTIAALE